MRKRLLLLTCTLIVYTLFCSSIAQAVQTKFSSKGYGKINEYEMALEVLQESENTKLHIDIYSSILGYNVPHELKKVQIKGFDECGKEVFTKNFFNITLDSGLGIIELNNIYKFQNLSVIVWIKTSQSVDQEILREDNVTVSIKPCIPTPQVIAVEAANTGNSEGLNAGDSLTIKFDIDTNQPSASGKYGVDRLIDFGLDKSLGTNYTGIWLDAKTLLIRIFNATGGNISVGDIIKIKQYGSLRNADNTSESCNSGFAIGGNFGDNEVIAVSFKDPNLESSVRAALYISEGNITNLDMAKLMRLVVSGKQIKDLTGLEYGININMLYLSGNEITDITPISNLQSLKELYLNGNCIEKVAGISNLGNLQVLNISENIIADIYPLKNLTGLQVLDASYNKINNISPLKDMVNIKELNLSYNAIEDVSVLENMKDLESLNLSYNNINAASSLSGFTNLTSLSIQNNQCSDLSPIQGLLNLQYLNFSENNVKDIEPLGALINLGKLYMCSNDITDISGLGKLINLNTLDLTNNGLSDISVLDKMEKLTLLKLGYTKVSDINPLKNIKNLQSLYMDNCDIIDISSLRGLTGIFTLVVSNNNIEDISSLETLTNLRWTILSGNRIADISSLVTNSNSGGIGRGDYIDLAGNQLDITEGSEDMKNIQILTSNGATVKYAQ